jgi:hypothetical protein
MNWIAKVILIRRSISTGFGCWPLGHAWLNAATGSQIGSTVVVTN